MNRIRRQKPLAGRLRISATAMKEIEREVSRCARRFRVSKSFVMSVALADYFGIRDQESFEAPKRRRARVLKYPLRKAS